jgi:hypothetical protein
MKWLQIIRVDRLIKVFGVDIAKLHFFIDAHCSTTEAKAVCRCKNLYQNLKYSLSSIAKAQHI